MLTKTATPLTSPWRAETVRIGRALADPRLLILIMLAFLVGLLAYQAPARADIPVGWLGDRLFLHASEGQSGSDDASFYGDEITNNARSGRSRWTHAGAEIRLLGLGAGPARVTLRAQGWPEDVLQQHVRQPQVTVLANGSPVGIFTPGPSWDDQSINIPAALASRDDLVITLQSSDVFTGTRQFRDLRPKGIRIEYVGVRGGQNEDAFSRPALLPLAFLALNAALWLLTFLALTNRPNLSFVLATFLVAGVALALAVARAWTVVLLPWLAVLGVLALVIAWRSLFVGLLIRIICVYQRGSALNYGLVAAGSAWLLAIVSWLSSRLPMPTLLFARENFADSLIYGLLGMSLLLLALVLGRKGLPRFAQAVVDRIGSRLGARALLALLLLGWGGYIAAVILVLPYVGHADYADNAVVARNLLAGRGWVVDYISQFYQLYPGITRPQETWPLMQPLWILPFFALFGPTAQAAKLPNLIFLVVLGFSIYVVGTRLWDRRVGLTAALLVLTNHLFFKLVIYTTSDLAFVLFAFGAIWLLYRATEWRTSPPLPPAAAQNVPPMLVGPIGWWALLGSGLLTGLMIVQKPGSGGILALGIGCWLVGHMLRRWAAARRTWARTLLATPGPILLWGVAALLLVTPLVVRNLQTFGAPYYSTEGHDAWVIEYTDWDKIYGVYTPELSTVGVPDRSWILRWGFDRTQLKISRQFVAVRDYLVPGWQGLPLGLDGLAGRSDKDIRLLFDGGAWLALLGLIGALGTRRRLIGLLLAAFVPYTLFLAIYWHANEERYFVVVMPWLAILAASALWRGYDRIAAIGDRRWAPLGLAIALTALVLAIQPSWAPIDEKIRSEPQLYAADLDAYNWLRTNTPPGSVMMTRNPWQLNWSSDRPAVMIPYTTDRTVLLRLARYYKARYLVLDSLQRPEPEVRALIGAMLADSTLSFRAIYQTPIYVAEYGGSRKEISAEIFAFPDDYGGAAAIR